MNLTPANYHSADAEREYMSYHQFRNWVQCPACEWARQHGLYTTEMTDALMIGKRVDVAILTPDDLPAFDADTESREWFYTKAGKPNAAYETSERCIARIRREPDAELVLSGEHQAIMTFEIDGVAWRCAIDALDVENKIVTDLKTTKGFDAEWVYHEGRNTKVQWYEARGYWGQLAVYRYAVKQRHSVECTCFILAVAKRDPADLEIIPFVTVEVFDREIEYIKLMQPSIMGWKTQRTSGGIPRCEQCDYCISTKLIDIDKLMPAERLIWPELVNRWSTQQTGG